MIDTRKIGIDGKINGEMHQEEVDLDINFDLVEKKILGLVNYNKNQGRVQETVDAIGEGLDLEPKIEITKKNTNTTLVKMA